MVGLKTRIKNLRPKTLKDDQMKDKAKLPKEKKLKSSKSLIDISIFKDKKKSKKKEEDRLVVSSWDVSGTSSLLEERETSWVDEDPATRSDPTHKKGHLRRSSSVDNLSLYSVSHSPHVQPEPKVVSSASSSRPPSTTATFPQDSSDDSISTAPSTVAIGLIDKSSRPTPLNSLSQSTPAISARVSQDSLAQDGRRTKPRHRGRTKRFLRRFPTVEPSEKVLDYYACALVADILLQGTLFITDNYFAFHSNIFGYVSKILIPISQVTKIQKEKTAKFIPNAIGVKTENGETYVFSSLLSRDSTYKVMMFTWRKAFKLFRISDDENTYTVKEVDENYEEDSCSISGEDSLLEEDEEEEGAVQPNSTHEPKEQLAATAINLAAGPSRSSAPPVAASVASTTSSSSENTAIEAIQRKKSQQPDLPSNHVQKVRQAQKVDRQTRRMSADRQTHRGSSSEDKLQSVSSTPPGESSTPSVIASVMMVPLRLVFRCLSSVSVVFEQSLISTASSFLVILLLISAAFMLHRVEELGKQMASGEIPLRGDLYEEVLLMQQKLHSVLATDVEKNIDSQLKQLATVRESLESLMYLFNEQASQAPRVKEEPPTNQAEAVPS